MLTKLPIELVLHVLQFMDSATMCSLRSTCRTFKSYIDNDLSLSYWQYTLTKLFGEAQNGVQQIALLVKHKAIAQAGPPSRFWPIDARGKVFEALLKQNNHLCAIDLRIWKMPSYALKLLTCVVSLTVHVDIDGSCLPPHLRHLRLRFGAHASSLPQGLQVLCMELQPGRLLPPNYFPLSLKELHIINYSSNIAGPVYAPTSLCRIAARNVAIFAYAL